MARERNNVTQDRIMACTYCIDGSLEDYIPLCHNRKSPYYDANKGELTTLTFRQALMGCNKIRTYNSFKIPPKVFRLVPKDSFLRTVPFERTVEGYTPDMNLDTEITVDDLASENEQNVGRLIEILQSSPEGLSLDEVRRRMNDTQED